MPADVQELERKQQFDLAQQQLFLQQQEEQEAQRAQAQVVTQQILAQQATSGAQAIAKKDTSAIIKQLAGRVPFFGSFSAQIPVLVWLLGIMFPGPIYLALLIPLLWFGCTMLSLMGLRGIDLPLPTPQRIPTKIPKTTLIEFFASILLLMSYLAVTLGPYILLIAIIAYTLNHPDKAIEAFGGAIVDLIKEVF